MTAPIKVTKVIENGKVAVAYSPGYGSGWATWVDPEYQEWCLFDKAVIDTIRSGVVDEGIMERLVSETFGPDAYIYCGGANNLSVRLVPEGALFVVEEHDGSEFVILLSDIPFFTA